MSSGFIFLLGSSEAGETGFSAAASLAGSSEGTAAANKAAMSSGFIFLLGSSEAGETVFSAAGSSADTSTGSAAVKVSTNSGISVSSSSAAATTFSLFSSITELLSSAMESAYSGTMSLETDSFSGIMTLFEPDGCENATVLCEACSTMSVTV